MKKYIMIIMVFFIAASAMFAQSELSAVIREMTGTVELKKGSSAGWVAAKAGDKLEKSTIISTGFKSTAILAIGNSIISVRPLTRLTLEELMTQEQTETINVSLNTGKVRVEINAPAGGRTNATFQSPSATASVRGTVFEFDMLNLVVKEGTVAFAGSAGNPVTVDAGGSSFVDNRLERAIIPMETMFAELRPSLPQASDVVTGRPSGSRPSDGSGVDLVVNITFSK